MKILKAKKDDFIEIRKLDKLIFKDKTADGENIWKIWIEYCKVIKAVHNKKIVSVGLLIPTFKKQLVLHKIFVHPRFQDQKIGEKIMMGLLKNENRPVYLTVRPINKKAINLYNRFGFKILKEIKNYYGKGEDRYLMIKKSKGGKK